jgi:DNA-binding response OmpR family regulator
MIEQPMAPDNAAKTVLIVEDEPKLARLLIDYLQNAGFATRWVDNGVASHGELKITGGF